MDATLDITVDNAVVFVFQVVNTGSRPVDLEFRSGQTADVVVLTAETEDPVWQWSADKMFTQALATKRLNPEQTLERDYTWENPRSGEYTAIATLKADVEAEARTQFSVP